MNKNALHSNFEGDLKVLKRSKLSRNHEFSSLLAAVERFHRDLKLSSLQCKDRNQLNQQWEDQQFYRILIRMMHEVTITTGMKQKEDLKKVYQWYQTNKSVLHSQPHFKGAAAKEVYKRPVLKFAPDALKYYSTPHDRRRQKRVAFDGDGKARRRQQPGDKEEEVLEDEGGESEDGRRGGQRPVTAPAGLHRPKVTNNLPKSPDSSRPESRQDDASFAAGFINSHVSPTSPDIQMMQRPSSALGLLRQSQIYDQESIVSGDLKTNVSADYLSSSRSNQNAPSVLTHSPGDDSQSEASKPDPNSPRSIQYSHTTLESQSFSSIASRETATDMAAILNYKHPISSLVNPVARVQFDEELYDGGQSPDERSKSPIKLQMHIDIPTDSAREFNPATAEDIKTENLQKWKSFQERQDYGQDVASVQSFYGHGGLPSNTRYASHSGGEMPEFYTQDVIASYTENTGTNLQKIPHPVDAITSPSLEQFYELTERHSPLPRPSSRSGKYTDPNTNRQSAVVRGYIADEVAPQLRNGMVAGTHKEKTVKFESVVDLADQVGDQLALQKEKLTPEPRHGYRQPMLKISPVHPHPHSAKQAAAASPPTPDRQPPPLTPPDATSSQSGPSFQESSKVLFAPPNSSRQSTCSSTDFTPRNKRGDPIILLPETSQYTVHFRRKDRPESGAYIPHAISRQGRVVPDQQRYKWRDDGFGNLTYYQIPSRASSAPGKRSLRSAGATSAGYRPRTATEPSSRYDWNKSKATDNKPRIPQAASHNTVSIGPQTLASLMVVNHLGSEQRRGRARMGFPGYHFDEETEGSPPAMEYMSITGPAKLTTRGQADKAISIPTDETHSTDGTALHPLSQASPLESLPSQEWLYKQGSSNGLTEGQEMPASSRSYADSLEGADSERTDDRSLSQDLGDLEELDNDVLNQSQNSQDLGSDDLHSSGVGSLTLDSENISIPQDDTDTNRTPLPVNDRTNVPFEETSAADEDTNLGVDDNQCDSVSAVPCDAGDIKSVSGQSVSSEVYRSPELQDAVPSLAEGEEDSPPNLPSDQDAKSDADVLSEHSAKGDLLAESQDDRPIYISNYSETYETYDENENSGPWTTSGEKEMTQGTSEH